MCVVYYVIGAVDSPKNSFKSITRKKMKEKKMIKVCSSVNQLLNIVSNEPSLGLYRIQEHVRKSVPKLQTQVKFINFAINS